MEHLTLKEGDNIMESYPTMIQWMKLNEKLVNEVEQTTQEDKVYYVLKKMYDADKKEFNLTCGVKPIKIDGTIGDGDDRFLESAINTIADVLNLSIKNGTMKNIAYEYSPEDEAVTVDIMKVIDSILQSLQTEFNKDLNASNN